MDGFGKMSECKQAHASAPSQQEVLRLFVVGVVVVMAVVWLTYPTLQGNREFADFSQCSVTPNEVIADVSNGFYKILTLPSENLVVRAAYLDPRPRDHFKKVTVFLAVISKKLLARKGNGIVACGTISEVSTVLRVRLVQNMKWVHHRFPSLTHDLVMVDCFGLRNTNSGIPAFLWYRLMDGGDLYRVESEQPYFVPLRKKDEKQDNLMIVVCMAVLYRLPPFIKEFVRYYKSLGVDHIYMMVEESFLRFGALEADEFVQETLKEGFISFSVWHYWLSEGKQVYYRSQTLSYQNCIYRFQGTYDYALIVDSDDYFIPLVPKQKRLDYYVKHFCKKGACIFRWIEYYPKCGQDWSRLGPNGNVTNTLSSHTSQVHSGSGGKALYRISAALDAGIHAPSQLMKGYESQLVPSQKAYMAHIRIDRAPPGGMQSC